MKLNNSIKISIANFALFWKILLYKCFAFALSLLFALPVLNVVKKCFAKSGFNSALLEMFNTTIFEGVPSFMEQLKIVIDSLFKGLKIIILNYPLVFVYVLIFVFFIVSFIFNFCDLAVSESVYGYMSSLDKSGFLINFANKLDKSLAYSCFRALFQIPLILILGLGFYGILALSTVSNFYLVLSPLLLFIFIVFMLDLNAAIFTGWTSSIVVFNCGVLKAFKKSIVAALRKIGSILSSFAVIYAISLALSFVFGLYALLIIIPINALITTVFGQVLFFESQGMNYYVSPDKIINTKKLEQTDKIKKVKFVI